MDNEQILEGDVVENLPAIVDRGEIDVQIATARRYPRSLKTFLNKALEMATLDEETAASCFYKLPRGSKTLEGPGVRLAEIVASAWGNIRFGARLADETEKFIKADGFAHDLETNTAVSFQVMRRITDKYGKRYGDDMIMTTANAASAIALRNAVFRVVPKAYVDQIFRKAKKVAIGDASTLADRRVKAVEYFQKMGIMLDRILPVLGRAGVEEITLDDLETLLGLGTAIKEGTIKADDAFPPVGSGTVPQGTSIKDKLKQQAEAVKPQPTQPAQPQSQSNGVGF